MMILIDGVNFHNKGAEMMLREIVRRFNPFESDVSLAVSIARGDFISRAKLGLYQFPAKKRYRIDWGFLVYFLPVWYRKLLGVVIKDDFDVVLDASGFRYSEQFNKNIIKNLAKRSANYRRLNKKFILLPQAFGPFSFESKQHLEIIVENANLIYPRDLTSYKYFVDLVGERDNIKIAPDFTATLPGIILEKHKNLHERFCIIPNQRMVDKTNSSISSSYVQVMRKCLQYAINYKLDPFFLVHETYDAPLAHKIMEGFDNIEIIIESDSPIIKGIISKSSAVISSRFHGLVSALSQGVPALGTGWSHKYKMLYNDYEFEEGFINLPCDDKILDSKIQMLADDISREKIRKHLIKVAEQQKLKIDSLWDEVFTELNLN